jgi:DNA-binding transcriptional ArsR family regulator
MSGFEYEALLETLRQGTAEHYTSYYESFIAFLPLDLVLPDIGAFQNRLADLWQAYWDAFFSLQVEQLRPDWENALIDKKRILTREGGQALYEHLVEKKETPPMLPPDHPATEIVVIPLALHPSSNAYRFYGYGNVTVLFDSQRTEAYVVQQQEVKAEIRSVAKALSDDTRLNVLRLIAQFGGQMNGKAIAHKLCLSPSAVSRHLTQLRESGLIEEEPLGNRVIAYHIRREKVDAFGDRVLAFLYDE